tara:strand:+ start:1753 stop:2244 length:492 start_codon:yes stop_codon:yes gene_type:complete
MGESVSQKIDQKIEQNAEKIKRDAASIAGRRAAKWKALKNFLCPDCASPIVKTSGELTDAFFSMHTYFCETCKAKHKVVDDEFSDLDSRVAGKHCFVFGCSPLLFLGMMAVFIIINSSKNEFHLCSIIVPALAVVLILGIGLLFEKHDVKQINLKWSKIHNNN